GQQHGHRGARALQQGVPILPARQRRGRGGGAAHRAGPADPHSTAAPASPGEVMTSPTAAPANSSSRAYRREGGPVQRMLRTTGYHVVSLILAITFLFPLIWGALD